MQPLRELRQLLPQLVVVRHRELGRRRRRRRSEIGDEVRDREVRLVADGRDDGNRGGADSPRNGFLVECPELLERAAAAAHDEHVGFTEPVHRFDRLDDRRRRLPPPVPVPGTEESESTENAAAA